MKYVEVRRHTLCDPTERPTADGLQWCRQARAMLRPEYDVIVSSPKRRAQATLRAWGFEGFDVDEAFGTLRKKGLAPYRPALESLMAHKRLSFLEACWKLPAVVAVLRREGRRFLASLARVAGRMPKQGHALVVSHGGVIEAAGLLAGDAYDLAAIGGPLKPCEGILFVLRNKGRLTHIEVRRLATETSPP